MVEQGDTTLVADRALEVWVVEKIEEEDVDAVEMMEVYEVRTPAWEDLHARVRFDEVVVGHYGTPGQSVAVAGSGGHFS